MQILAGQERGTCDLKKVKYFYGLSTFDRLAATVNTSKISKISDQAEGQMMCDYQPMPCVSYFCLSPAAVSPLAATSDLVAFFLGAEGGEGEEASGSPGIASLNSACTSSAWKRHVHSTSTK